MSSRALVWFCFAALSAAPAAAQSFAPLRASAEEERAAIEWIASNAVPTSPSGPTESQLAPIVERLKGARIIGIGEATHGTHEDQAFKAELIRALVRAGQVRLLLIEGNIAPNARLDAYIQHGEGDPANALRDPSQFRNMKGDEFASLVLWLRAWNLSHPDDKVAIAGFDLQDPGRDGEKALAYIGRHDAEFASRLKAIFAPFVPAVEGGTYPRLFTVLDKAEQSGRSRYIDAGRELEGWFLARKESLGKDPEFAAAQEAAIATRQGMSIYEYGMSPPEGTNLAEYYSRRDRFMADNALRLQGRNGRGAVIWAHDAHVIDRYTPEVAALGIHSLGTDIEARLGDDYRAVGFVWSRGTLRTTLAEPNVPFNKVSPDDRLVDLESDGPGTIGRLFAAALPNETAAWFDMDALRAEPKLKAFRAASYEPPYAGWFVYAGQWLNDFDNQAYPWTAGFDILVWHREVTPQRRWPDLPSVPVTQSD